MVVSKLQVQDTVCLFTFSEKQIEILYKSDSVLSQ